MAGVFGPIVSGGGRGLAVQDRVTPIEPRMEIPAETVGRVPMSSDDKIEMRVRDASATTELKDYMYNLRRFVLGDERAWGGKFTVEPSFLGRLTKQNPIYPSLRITQHEEGVSNHTLTWLLTLAKQTVAQKHSFDFPDLLDKEAALVREGWLHDRMRRSEWRKHEFTLIQSYLIDGFAFCRLNLMNGMAAGKYADTIDMLWDLHAETVHDMRFVAKEMRITEDVARATFSKDVVATLLREDKVTEEPRIRARERIIRIIEYWDGGTLAYLRFGDQGIKNTTVMKRKPNPFGFIPYSVMSGPRLPSVIAPLPHIINVIGAQTAHAEIQRSLLETERKMRPIILLRQGAFTPESLAEFQENPQDVSVLILLPDEDPVGAVTFAHVDKVPTEALQLKRDLEDEIVRHLGVNPFASGAPIRPEFAEEVKEIRANTGISQAFLADDLQDFGMDFFRKWVRVGAIYDDQPFTYRLGKRVIRFGPDVPIQPVLKEDVEVDVRAGRFEDDATKIIKARILWKELNATIPELRTTFPTLYRDLLESLLLSFDKRDVETLLDPPTEEQMKLEIVRQIPLEVLQAAVQAIGQLLEGGGGAQGAQGAQGALPAPSGAEFGPPGRGSALEEASIA